MSVVPNARINRKIINIDGENVIQANHRMEIYLDHLTKIKERNDRGRISTFYNMAN